MFSGRPSDLRKSKKKKREQTRLERIVFGRKFGFYAPYTIEECAELLLARSERHPRAIGFQARLLVMVEKVTPDFYTFSLDMGPGNPPAEVLGILTRAEGATLVEARGRIGLFWLGWCVIWIVFTGYGALGLGIVFFALMGLLPLGFAFFQLASERERLCNLTYKILDKYK
jgi:hypothetical protein